MLHYYRRPVARLVPNLPHRTAPHRTLLHRTVQSSAYRAPSAGPRCPVSPRIVCNPRRAPRRPLDLAAVAREMWARYGEEVGAR